MDIQKDVIYKFTSRGSGYFMDATSARGWHFMTNDENSGSTTQEFLLYELDGKRIVFANTTTGLVMSYSPSNQNIFSYEYNVAQGKDSSPDQEWHLLDADDDPGAIYIQSQDNGDVVTALPGFKTFLYGRSLNYTNYERWLPSQVGKIKIPQLPILQELGSIPQYSSSTTNMPEQTEEVLVGAVLLPYFVVNDNSWSPATKVQQTPYYIMEHYQRWVKLYEDSFAPGETKEHSVTYGIKHIDQTTMENTISTTVGADGGFNIEGATASVKTEMTDSLRVTESQTTETMTDTTDRDTVVNPYQTTMSYSKYIIQDRYVLKRANGSQAFSVIVKNKTTLKGTSWPNQASLKNIPLYQNNSQCNCKS